MIQVYDHGPVRELRLDHPPANALNQALLDQLARQILKAPEDDKRALVISGAPKMFSAGIDVRSLSDADRDTVHAFWISFLSTCHDIAHSELPIAAAMTGHSPAGGMVLALLCDHRVMAEGRFKLGLNEVEVGLPVPTPVLVAYERLLGRHRAEELAIRGDMVVAEQAHALGLVDELLPLDQVIARAVSWARELAERPPRAMQDTRAFCRRDLLQATDGFGEEMAQRYVDIWFSDECQQAMRAMLQRIAKKKGG